MTDLFSFYNNTGDVQGRPVTLQEVINRIRLGSSGLAEKTEYANKITNDAKKYRLWKTKNLPGVTFSGIFLPGKRCAHLIHKHTGRIIIDIDGLNEAQIGDLLTELRNYPQVILAFVSPSGKGIKVLVHVAPIPEKHTEHQGAFKTCIEFFRLQLEAYDIRIGKPKKGEPQDVAFIDTSGSDCSRLCFLAHDPQVIVREDAVPIQWDREEFLAEQAQIREREKEYDNSDADIDIAALDYIDADDYDIWIKVGMASYRAGVSLSVWDEWSQKSDKYIPNECASKWQTFQEPEGLDEIVSWGTVVYLAKENGYDPKNYHEQLIESIRDGKISPLKARRPPQKLVKKNNEIVLANIEMNREDIQKALRSKKRITLLKSWTGDGKSTGCIELALVGEKLMMGTATEKKADEDTAAFISEAKKAGVELTVHRYKSLKFGFDERIPIDERLEKGAMCAFADIRAEHQSKGGSGYQFCRTCPFLELCEKRGYLSQAEKMLQADVVVFCFPSIVTDPGFLQQAEKFIQLPDERLTDADGQPIPERNKKGEILRDECGDPIYKYRKRYRTVIFDEATAQNLYPQCSLSKKRIEQWRDMWQGEPLSEFALNLLYALNQENPIPILRRVITEHNDEAEDIITQMRQLRYPATFTPTGSSGSFKGNMILTGTQIKIPVAKNWQVYNTCRESRTPVLPPNVASQKFVIFHNLDEAIFYGIFDITKPEGIRDMPSVESNKTWTYWHKLKALFDEFPHDDTVPLVHQSGSQGDVLYWYIHPRLHPNVSRIIFMGASLDIPMAKAALRTYSDDMDVMETPPTQFVAGARYLQLATGRYPRSSLLTTGKVGEYTGFSLTGQRFIDLIHQEIRKKPKVKFGLVTFKWIVDECKEPWRNKYPNLVYFENFDQALGTNPDIDVLFVLGTPEIPEDVVLLTAKRLFGGTEEGKKPIDTLRTGSDDFNDGCPYVDPRMQTAWRLEVVERLQQVIGRARLNLYPRCVVVLTAVRLPYLTDRESSVLFDVVDWKIAEDLDNLPDVVSAHEQAITEIMYLRRNNINISKIADEMGLQRRRVLELVTQIHPRRYSTIKLEERAIWVTSQIPEPLQQEICACFQEGDILRTAEIVEKVGKARQKVSTALTVLVRQGILKMIKKGSYRLSDAFILEEQEIVDKINVLFNLDLGPQLPSASSPDRFFQAYTNVAIGNIVDRPLYQVNRALSRLEAQGLCKMGKVTNLYTRVMPARWTNPSDAFVVYSEAGKLLACGTVHASDTVFMLCDFNAPEVGKQPSLTTRQSLDRFFDAALEAFNIDDGTIVCDDLNDWGPLPNIPKY